MSRAENLILKLESSINPNQPVHPQPVKPKKHSTTAGWDKKKEEPLGKEPDKPYEPGEKQKW